MLFCFFLLKLYTIFLNVYPVIAPVSEILKGELIWGRFRNLLLLVLFN